VRRLNSDVLPLFGLPATASSRLACADEDSTGVGTSQRKLIAANFDVKRITERSHADESQRCPGYETHFQQAPALVFALPHAADNRFVTRTQIGQRGVIGRAFAKQSAVRKRDFGHFGVISRAVTGLRLRLSLKKDTRLIWIRQDWEPTDFPLK